MSLSHSLAHVRLLLLFSLPLSLPRALSLRLTGSLPIALSKAPPLHLPLLFICDIITWFRAVIIEAPMSRLAITSSKRTFRLFVLAGLRERTIAAHNVDYLRCNRTREGSEASG